MTYFLFLVVFIVPAILLAGLLTPRALPGVPVPLQVRYLGLICLLAFVYTTPWDNYLVYRGIWWYGPDRVWGTIGYVPYEEYLFFILQPILTGTLYLRMLARSTPSEAIAPSVRLWGALLLGGFSVLGGVLLVTGRPGTLYLGLILTWACPVLAILWAYAGAQVRRHGRAFAATLFISTAYLWVIDRTAIGLGIWAISGAYSVGWNPFGLPVEEAIFFLLTNVLVLLGLSLFLFGHGAATEPVRPG
jgi:lycopene cyclase domain-containing protein